MNQLAQRTQASFVLKVLNGPEKGTLYRLLSHSVKIGREADNDISLTHDPKISRHHAVITMGSHGVEIKNVSGRNVIAVDGRETSEAILKPNSVIQIGDTKLQFNLLQDNKSKGLAASPGGSPLSGPSMGLKRKKRRSSSTKSGLSPTFYVLVGVIGVIVYILATSDSGTKEEKQVIRTEDQILTQIEENKKVAEDVNAKIRERGRDTREYREAQTSYVKGFRDYQKGQYERAMGHFQTCLAIYPQHPLCGQVYAEAKNKFDQVVQSFLRLGYENQRKNLFRQCMNAFRNVQIMVKDKSSSTFKEAEAGYKACEARERERF